MIKLILLQFLVCGLSKSIGYFPNQILSPSADYFISDPDNILLKNDFESLNKRLISIQPLQIAILIIKKIHENFLEDYRDQDKAAQAFSTQVFSNWDIGDHSKTNVVMIFLSTEDRKLRIITGEGARKSLSDKDADEMFEYVKPLLRKKDFAKAIDRSVNEILECFNRGEGREKGGNYSYNQSIIIFLIIIVIITLLMLIGDIFYSKYLKEPSLPEFLEKLKDLQKKGKLTNSFISSFCVLCLEPLSAFDSKENALRCGHSFHEHCLDAFLKVNNFCPFCKIKDPKKKAFEEEKRENEAEDEIFSENLLMKMVEIQRSKFPELSNNFFYVFSSNSFTYTQKNQKTIKFRGNTMRKYSNNRHEQAKKTFGKGNFKEDSGEGSW